MTVWSNSCWHYRPQSDNTTCSMKGKGDRNKQHQSTAMYGITVPVHDMKARGGVKVWLHSFTKNWDEWSVSGAGRIYRWERASDTYWIWGWVPSSIPEQVRTFCRREISTLSGTEPRFFSRPVHKSHYNRQTKQNNFDLKQGQCWPNSLYRTLNNINSLLNVRLVPLFGCILFYFRH